MKKRILSLLLVVCLLLPASAFAAAREDKGPDCFAFLKAYLIEHGTLKNGVYTYCGVEKSVDDDGQETTIDIILSYDSRSNALTFADESKQTMATYHAELTIPASLSMPYDAAQTMKAGIITISNQAKIGADFTREGELAVTGETYGLDMIPELFANSVALVLRYVQDNLLYGSGYTIADLGFTALFQELYGNHKHETALKNAEEATCTEPGYTGDEICNICAETVKQGSVIPALGHTSAERNAQDPTCTEPGQTAEVYCTVCGEVLQESTEIAALGHTPVEGTAKEPTCTEPGHAADTVCSVCGEVLQSGAEIPALGHKTAERNAQDPTCTEPGQTAEVYCTVCGEVLQESRELPALGHSWDEGVVTKEPTSKENGEKTFTCTVCGETRTESIPMLDCTHEFEDTIVPPTCTEDGYTIHKCKICGYSYQDTPVAASHHPELRNQKDASCTEAGYTGDEVCTVCGEVLQQGSEIAALGHKTELKNAKEPTETEPGYTGDEICTVCGETVKQGSEIPALGPKKCDGGKNCPSREFTDVDHGPDSWYHEPVDWAVTAGVTNGKTPTSFAPGESCTRGQMVTFLWRAKGSPEPISTTNPFVDVPDGQYYTKAVLWALENEITNGMDATHFGPNETVKRSQTVTFLWRMQAKPSAAGTGAFVDVPGDAFYTDAVAWAVANGITNGMDEAHFGPNNDCTRAQIVTFLYRTIVK